MALTDDLLTPPLQSPFEDISLATGKPSGYFNRTWVNFFDALWTRLAANSAFLKRLSVPEQSAALPATPIPVGSVEAGWYRVSVYLRVTQAATTSGDVTVTIEHVDNSINCEQDSQTVTNDVTKPISDTLLVKMDAGSPLTFTTTYNSVGATQLKYRVDVLVEKAAAA